MSESLQRCLAFLARLDEGCAERIEPMRYGAAYFQPSLPRVYSLNLLVTDGAAAAASAQELAAEAERLQAAAGLEHRKLSVRDAAAGSRAAPGFRALGWRAEPLVVMVWTAERDVDTASVSEVERERLEPVWRAGLQRGRPALDAAAVEQVTGQRSVIGRAGRARYFARLVGDRVASYCELYSDGATGQIEGVLTEPDFRGRGYASAVVTRALAESRAAGHDLTFLLALEEDWPKELYAKLGFRAAGRIWNFLREPPA